MSRKHSAPNSQIPFCDDYEDNHHIHGTVLDEIQREAEQELQYAEKILSAADDLVAENRESFLKRGACKRMGAMRNMPSQFQNENFLKHVHHPSQRYLPQDHDTSYFPRNTDFTEKHCHQRHLMPSSTPHQSDVYEYHNAHQKFLNKYQRSAQDALLDNRDVDNFYYNDVYQTERAKQHATNKQRSFSSSPSRRNPQVDANTLSCSSQMQSSERFKGNDNLRATRTRETCAEYTCNDPKEKLCRQFAACEKNFVQRKAWPKKPAATHEELHQMIENESKDVDMTLSLTAQEKKTYKKPCPKQQRAQMTVQQILQAHEANRFDSCLKDYGPLSDPDPEDVSPELAASIMFAQEQGIKLDACPQTTIQHLFPDEKKNLNKIPGSTISVIDPKQGKQVDKEKLVERSSKVSEIGASDSAYTKIMKKKRDSIGSKKSFEPDGDDDDSKKEYVLVPQKPERFNMIQVRGNMPTWFPGYFAGFPESPGIRIMDSPSKILSKAWTLTYPGDLPASDITVID